MGAFFKTSEVKKKKKKKKKWTVESHEIQKSQSGADMTQIVTEGTPHHIEGEYALTKTTGALKLSR